MDGDYPKEITEGFTGIPDHIDAATVWTGNGKIYFYKGTKFWRFDPASKPPVRSNYPKVIKNWQGVPDHVNAAVTYKGYTYFFKDNAYYRFNDRTFSVSTGRDFVRKMCSVYISTTRAAAGCCAMTPVKPHRARCGNRG